MAFGFSLARGTALDRPFCSSQAILDFPVLFHSFLACRLIFGDILWKKPCRPGGNLAFLWITSFDKPCLSCFSLVGLCLRLDCCAGCGGLGGDRHGGRCCVDGCGCGRGRGHGGGRRYGCGPAVGRLAGRHRCIPFRIGHRGPLGPPRGGGG